MCRSMADIQSAAAEIRRGKKKEEEERRTNHSMKICMVSLFHRATIKKLNLTEINCNRQYNHRKAKSNQQTSGRFVYVCVCIALCIIVAHSATEQTWQFSFLRLICTTRTYGRYIRAIFTARTYGCRKIHRYIWPICTGVRQKSCQKMHPYICAV